MDKVMLLLAANYFVCGTVNEFYVLDLTGDVIPERIENVLISSNPMICADDYTVEAVIMPAYSHRTVVRVTHV